ncbi:MAG: OadG family protein [Bacteroidales bacterium]|nr:OadG family protein [Candidatus Hennigimonas equi]
MTILQQLGAAERVAQKAAHMLDVDPHGLTLTLVSVCVVFGALFLLYRAYLIIGKAFTGRYKRKASGSKADEQAAAIAIAIDRYLDEECGGEEQAAIALALHLYLEDEAVHDIESGIITIRR